MSIRASSQGFVRAWRCAWLASAALAALAMATSAAAQSPVRKIDVTYDGKTYVVNAQMFAPVPLPVAWDVLTDFPHMAGWVPNVTESKVLTPGDKEESIEQDGTAKFAGLSFPYTSVRQIVMEPQKTILSTQTKGSMRHQQSLMKLSTEGDGTVMDYRLEVEPNLIASTVMSKDFLAHEIDEQFTAIVAEMTKRKK
ncbi:MAG TPA: SRPBCC family protein [Variovorax sp.]|jgi:hypothetical protein